ncbi:MAG: type I 3-dehydroquinate dehydratase [Cuniculiplasma sp.]
MSPTFNIDSLRKKGKKPSIVASVIPSRDIEDQVERLSRKMDLFNFIPEIRMDLVKKVPIGYLENYFSTLSQTGINCIFTFRANTIEEAEEPYEEALMYENTIIDVDTSIINAIDMEKSKKRMIISSHFQNFLEFRSRSVELFAIRDCAVKLATSFDQLSFTEALWYMTQIKGERIFSLVPQGSENREMRVVSAIQISDFTYSFFEEPVAPGQYSLDQIHNIMDAIFP